jgi:prophage regulatory protein
MVPRRMETPELRILRAPEVLKRVGLSRSTVWRLERKNQFPQRVRLTDRVVGWIEADVDRWIEQRGTEQAR